MNSTETQMIAEARVLVERVTRAVRQGEGMLFLSDLIALEDAAATLRVLES